MNFVWKYVLVNVMWDDLRRYNVSFICADCLDVFTLIKFDKVCANLMCGVPKKANKRNKL